MNDKNTSFGFESARYLAEDIGIRFSGTPAEVAAADYVSQQFKSLGFTVQMEPFKFLGWEMTGPGYVNPSDPFAQRGASYTFHLV